MMARDRQRGYGTLPPGAAKQLERALAGYRKARDAGVDVRVEILGSNGCPMSMARVGMIYDLDSVPELPLDGCERLPCCACAYGPVVREEPARKASAFRIPGRRLIVALSLALLAVAAVAGFLLLIPLFTKP